MSFSIKLPTANFTKYVATVFPEPANMLGFYDFQASELENFAPLGTINLTRQGAPALGTFGRIVGPNIGYDTGMAEPNAAVTYLALVKGVATATASLIMTSFADPITTPRGMSLSKLGSNTVYTSLTTAAVTINGSGITIDTTKYYLVATRRNAPGAGVTTDLIVFAGGAPTVFTGAAETIPAPPVTTVKLGWNTGTVYGTGTIELVAAGLWQRKLTNANLQNVYNYFVGRYPSIPMA